MFSLCYYAYFFSIALFNALMCPQQLDQTVDRNVFDDIDLGDDC